MADAMKLLPCPMCGGEAALLDYEARYGGLHYASRCPQCASCGCSMGYLPTAKKAVEAWNCRASMPPEKTPSFDDARRKLIHCIEQWDGETEYDAEDIAALADDILDVFASPPARAEAPAEGAAALADRVIALGYTNTAEYALAKAYLALRNRTSEPEAGAVAWRVWRHASDAGFGRPQVFTTDEASEGDLKQWRRNGYDVQPLYLHPAPATADKLKVAKEALERIAGDDDEPELSNGNLNDLLARQFWNEARQALAALNEQPQ